MHPQLANFLDGIYATAAKAESGQPSGTPVSREQLEQTHRTLEYLSEITAQVYDAAVRGGLKNKTLTAASLNSIHVRSEQLVDLADWFRVALGSKPDALDAIFARGRADLAEGKVYDLASMG